MPINGNLDLSFLSDSAHGHDVPAGGTPPQADRWLDSHRRPFRREFEVVALNKHPSSLVLEPIHQSLFSPEGWALAATQLALHIACGSAAFFFMGAENPIGPDASVSDEPDALACFLAADEKRPFVRMDSPTAPRGAYVLKRTARRRQSAGMVILEARGQRLDEAAERRLDEIGPHLDLALATGFNLADAQDQRLLGALDGLGLPAATINSVGAIVALNTRFGDTRQPWTALEGEPLDVQSPRLQARFAQLLSPDSTGVRSMLLRSNGAGAAHSLHMLPLPEAGIVGLAHSTMLLIGSPLEGPSAEMIASVFSLSPQEGQLAQSILSGQSVDEIAGSSGRSIHTIRNQRKAVLSKTGAHSQTQLASLVARLLPLRG